MMHPAPLKFMKIIYRDTLNQGLQIQVQHPNPSAMLPPTIKFRNITLHFSSIPFLLDPKTAVLGTLQ